MLQIQLNFLKNLTQHHWWNETLTFKNSVPEIRRGESQYIIF